MEQPTWEDIMMKALIFILLFALFIGFCSAITAEKANCTKDEKYFSFEVAKKKLFEEYGRLCKEDSGVEVVHSF